MKEEEEAELCEKVMDGGWKDEGESGAVRRERRERKGMLMPLTPGVEKTRRRNKRKRWKRQKKPEGRGTPSSLALLYPTSTYSYPLLGSFNHELIKSIERKLKVTR